MRRSFSYYFESKDLYFKYAKGEPFVKEREFHDYNEFVLFIDGEVSLISKNIQQRLIPGTLMLIPKEQFHQFCVEQPSEYVRCILGFYENSKIAVLVREVMNTIKVISVPDTRVMSVFENLIEFAKSDLPENEKLLLIESAIVELLIYHKKNTANVVDQNNTLSEPVARALDIIDESYAEPLSVQSIAAKLYISPSTLSHKFSRELNISVYRYITQKRLSVAKELIKSGETLTGAAVKCGFSDYSCFYRLYKKYI